MTRDELVYMLNYVELDEQNPLHDPLFRRRANGDVRCFRGYELERLPRFYLFQLVVRIVPFSLMSDREFQGLLELAKYFVARGLVSSDGKFREISGYFPACLIESRTLSVTKANS